jgi:hypothetical protein
VAHQPRPTGQPITHLPLLTALIEGMLELAEELYRTLQRTRPQLQGLAADSLGRLVEVVTAQRAVLGLFGEQLRRWEEQDLTERQQRAISRLTGRLERLEQISIAILELADELKSAGCRAEEGERRTPAPQRALR